MKRNYSLYERARGTRLWRKVGTYDLPQAQAARYYQDALLQAAFSGTIERKLAPVKGA